MSDEAEKGTSNPTDESTETEADPKAELFEAIDHFKNAASLLFDRATKDPAVQNATKEAERVMKRIGGAAEPFAKQLTDEVSRLTKDVLGKVDGIRKPPPSEKE